MSLRGMALAKGRSGRSFLLTPDATSIAEILSDITAQAKAAGLGDLTLSQAAGKPPAAKWSVNARATKATLKLKLRFEAAVPGGVRSGTWRLKLAGVPPAK